MRRGPLTGTLSLLSCLNHLSRTSSMSLHSGFQNRFILNPLCSIILTIFIVFPYQLDHRIYKAKFLTHVKFPFSIFYLSYKNLPFVCDLVILSHKQSPVNCSSRKVKGNFVHKANHSYYCHFPGLKFM